MLPDIPDISSLPVEQQVLAWVVFASVSALVFLVTKTQIAKGKETGHKEAEHAAVAAVIVDPGPLNRATAAVEAFSVTQMQTNANVTAQTLALVELGKQVQELAKQIEILGRVMRT